MSERLVALERDGALRLYAVNGEGPREVGHLVVGRLDDHTAAMVAAAFSDLREVVRTGQIPSPHGPSWFDLNPSPPEARPVEPVSSTPAALPRAKPKPKRAARTRSGGQPDPSSLNGLIRAYLAEHGPSEVGPILEGVAIEATATKSARQRVSTGLATLKRSGMVKREGIGPKGVWSLVTDERPPWGTAPATAPRKAVSAQTESDARALLDVLDRHPEGLGGIALFTMAKVDRSRRRALDLLIARGLVLREGQTRGSTWRRVTTAPDVTNYAPEPVEPEPVEPVEPEPDEP